ncbi:hypothetical protein OIU79_023098 [Salix purpurea]|uniref:Uncharacterized protein n=1 Tax=Salix purpurea TaxID=77065 RepID=A0A9Q0WI94_SALPP|nr:hypothetical protein OIU79_023098 [Salix purpurea]
MAFGTGLSCRKLPVRNKQCPSLVENGDSTEVSLIAFFSDFSQATKLERTQTSTVEFWERKLSEIDDVPVIPTAPKILKPEDSAGSPKTNISSSFNPVNHLIFNENQVIEENVGLLESTGEQCLRGPQFSAESQTCRVEDYGDTCTVEMWVQELLHGV